MNTYKKIKFNRLNDNIEKIFFVNKLENRFANKIIENNDIIEKIDKNIIAIFKFKTLFKLTKNFIQYFIISREIVFEDITLKAYFII